MGADGFHHVDGASGILGQFLEDVPDHEGIGGFSGGQSRGGAALRQIADGGFGELLGRAVAGEGADLPLTAETPDRHVVGIAGTGRVNLDAVSAFLVRDGDGEFHPAIMRSGRFLCKSRASGG